jgi:hypothetical protein
MFFKFLILFNYKDLSKIIPCYSLNYFLASSTTKSNMVSPAIHGTGWGEIRETKARTSPLNNNRK